jgi:hypothetical protein
MSDPTWGAQETKTFADFEQPLKREPVPMHQLDNDGVDQSKIGHTEHLPSLLEKLRPHFALAFGQQAREELDWEIGMMFYPNPQNQSMQAVLVIFAMTHGAVIGTTVSTSTMVPPLPGMENHVDEWVHQTLESLRNALSDQLRAMQEQPRDQGLQSPVNGGLIFPGK